MSENKDAGNWLTRNDKLLFVVFLPSVIYFVTVDSLITSLITGVDTGSVILQNLLRLVLACFLLVLYVGSGSSILRRKNRSQAWLLFFPNTLLYGIIVLALGDKSRVVVVDRKPYKYSSLKIVAGFGLFALLIIVIALIYSWMVA